jgi:hypothetical protein
MTGVLDYFRLKNQHKTGTDDNMQVEVYTPRMGWSFRALVLAGILVFGLAPQIACFLPDQPLTQAEMDCCLKMANDCAPMNMSCCRTVVRDDVGVNPKTVPSPKQTVDFAPKPVAVSVAAPATMFVIISCRCDNAPHHDIGASSLILRI